MSCKILWRSNYLWFTHEPIKMFPKQKKKIKKEEDEEEEDKGKNVHRLCRENKTVCQKTCN